MDTVAFDEMLVSAAEAPSKKNLDNILTFIAQSGNPVPAEIMEKLDVLWEGWGEGELDVAQGHFCIGLAALPITDNPVFRKHLAVAARVVLPPYLSRNPIMKALGVRDENTPLAEFSARFDKLSKLKIGTIVFLPSSMRWGAAGPVDNISGSMTLTPFGKFNTVSVPLELVLKEGVFLGTGPELVKLVDPGRGLISAADFRILANRKSGRQLPDELLRLMAQSGCASKFDGAAFAKYWDAAPKGAAAAAPGGRTASNGRSLKEIDFLLDKEAAAGAKEFTEADGVSLSAFFSNLKVDTARREAQLLATICGKIAMRVNNNELLQKIFTPVLGKAPFWPGKVMQVQLDDLSVWGEIPAKAAEGLAAVSAKVFPEQYLAELMMRIPVKALNQLGKYVGDEMLFDLYCEVKMSSCDLLLWIWKNRKKRSSELLSLLNVDNVCRTLAHDELPKAWGGAMRELRMLLVDDQAFQQQLLTAAGDDVMMFAAVLQGAIFLSSGERQSLMVKLSRLSNALRDYLEHGAGSRILQAGIGTVDAPEAPVSNEPNYTSVKSNHALAQELDNIINVAIPENREALKTARAHGDFRENSEFDAAKERRNFLSRRRTELERELSHVQPVVMSSVKVEDTAVIGSEITLTSADGKSEKYYLLGAWDGNPERRFLSYKTKLGAIVYQQKKGTVLTLPGGAKSTLSDVKPLPPDLIAELDAE